MEPDHIISIRRSLWWVIRASLVALAVLLIVAAVLKSFDGLRAHILNTFVALLVGALLAFVHMGAIRQSPRWAVAGLVTIAISQVCFLLWAWTGWATHRTKAWRFASGSGRCCAGTNRPLGPQVDQERWARWTQKAGRIHSEIRCFRFSRAACFGMMLSMPR